MIVKKIVDHPVGILICYIVVAIMGYYTLSGLAIELTPDITAPVLLVVTDYAGAGPEDVEKSITKPLESVLANVSGIIEMSSTSAEGISQITLRFNFGIDIDSKKNELRDKLEMARDILPEEAGTPQQFGYDPSLIPFMNLVMEGSKSIEDLRKIAEDQVQSRIEQIDGVASVSVTGGREKIIRVEISQNRLEAYKLTLTQISSALAGQNIQMSGGNLDVDNFNFSLRIGGEYSSIKEINDTVITHKQITDGSKIKLIPVKLSDIGKAYMGYKDYSGKIIVNGNEAIQISVQKQSSVNTVEVADKIYPLIESINDELVGDTNLKIIVDTTDTIRLSINQVTSSGLSGAVYAMVVLFIFLRNIKSTLIIGISIPVSVFITMMGMQFCGMTLNILSLSGLALGIGMVVDSSIVILENIYKYREKGAKLKSSAILGSQEMLSSIMASTLTTVFVFLPSMIFKSQLDLIGELFWDLSLTVILSLLASLLVAITLIPILSSHYLKIYTHKQRPLTFLPVKFLYDLVEFFLVGLENLYKNTLIFTLKFRRITIFLISFTLVASFLVFKVLDVTYMPASPEDSIIISLKLEAGTSLDITENKTLRFFDLLNQTIDKSAYKDIIIEVGEAGFFGGNTSYKGNINIALLPFKDRTYSEDDLKNKIRSLFETMPDIEFSFSSSSMMGGGGKPINIDLKGNDFDLLKESANKIKNILNEKVKETVDAELSVSEGASEYVLKIDRDRMYNFGLNILSVSQEIKANMSGITASKYRVAGEEFDIILYLEKQDRSKKLDIGKIGILNTQGNRIPLVDFITIEKDQSLLSISRVDRMRLITVEVGIAEGFKLSESQSAVEEAINNEIGFIEGVSISYGGDLANLIKYGTRAGIIGLLSVLLVYAIMASQFESFIDPFIIFFSIPLIFIGINLFYLIMDGIYSMFTVVGAIILAGLVVNNGIVFVDYVRLLRARGYNLNEACIESGRSRLRPILMTSLTTILGMLPLAFSKGEGSSFSQPIALSVTGGMIGSTFMTLYFVPCLYSVIHERILKINKLKKKIINKLKNRNNNKEILIEKNVKDISNKEDVNEDNIINIEQKDQYEFKKVKIDKNKYVFKKLNKNDIFDYIKK